MSHYDLQSSWGGFGDLTFADLESEARAPRVPRERPDRPGGGGGGSGGGGTGGGVSAPYVSGDPNVPDSYEYNIKITFQGSWPAALKNAVIVAAEAISDFIVGDLPDATTARGLVDDIALTARLMYIDGAGGVLAQSGPTAFRADITQLPFSGSLKFDVADANVYQASGLFDDIVLHEMLHTMGFGTLWQQFGLIDGVGTSTPTYNGASANAVYPGTDPIPLEASGIGTAYTHWDEAIFGNELMTGYLDGDDELSYMTVASLGDLGYSPILGASYVPPAFI